MALEFPARPRLIDKLRLWEVFRPHMGEDGAKQAVDALQDEFAQQATQDDLRTLMIWMEGRMNAMVNRILLGAAVIAGIALAIAELL